MLSAPLTLDSVMSFNWYMQIKQQQIMQDRGVNLNLSNYHIPHDLGVHTTKNCLIILLQR